MSKAIRSMLVRTLLIMTTAAVLLGATRPIKPERRVSAPADTCDYYLVKAPHGDDRETYQPFLDTTIVRSRDCGTHILHFPPRGTVSTYLIMNAQGDTVQHFTFRTGRSCAWDISHVPGEYRVKLAACYMGGEFRIYIR